jgi:hypothetical protein
MQSNRRKTSAIKPVIMDFEEMCQAHQLVLHREAKRDLSNREHQEKFAARMERLAARHLGRRVQSMLSLIKLPRVLMLISVVIQRSRHRRADSGVTVGESSTADTAANTAATTHTLVVSQQSTLTSDVETPAVEECATHEAHESEQDGLSFGQYIEANPTELYNFHSHFTEAFEDLTGSASNPA